MSLVPRRALLSSPVFIGSVAVLLFNDRVLKAAWPGFVTGKLSDVAGVAMITVLVTALTGRARFAFVTSAVGFGLLKTVPAVAVLSSPLLGGVTRTDPSDLLALGVLWPLWQWVEAAPRRPVVDRRRWLIAVQIVAISTAVFATTATSCDESGVYEIARDSDGTLIAVGTSAVSDDGGRTWLRSLDISPTRGAATPRTSCVDDGTCYSLSNDDRGVVLLEKRSGEETTLLTFAPAEVARLDDLDPPTCAAGPFSAVRAIDRTDGRHVVIAMGWLGVIHVGPDAPAEWIAVEGFGVQEVDTSSRPLGLDVAQPIGTKGFGFSLPRRAVALMLLGAPLLPFAAIPILVVMAKRRNREFDGAVWTCVAVGLLVGAATALVGIGFATGAQGRTITAAATVVFGVAVLAVAPWFVWHARAAAPPPPPRPPYPTAAPELRPLDPPPSSARTLPPPDASDRRGGPP